MVSPPGENWLPRHPADFHLVTRASWSSREPYKTNVLGLTPGQRLVHRRDPCNPHDSQAVRIETLAGDPVGYLNSDTAGFLAIVLDRAPGLTDHSTVESVLTAPPPNDAAARRLRYPRLFVNVSLHFESAWPMFTVAAVLGLKTDQFPERFNLTGNPWLNPLRILHERYLREGHDVFQLPSELVRAWQYLTRPTSDQL